MPFTNLLVSQRETSFRFSVVSRKRMYVYIYIYLSILSSSHAIVASYKKFAVRHISFQKRLYWNYYNLCQEVFISNPMKNIIITQKGLL